MKTFTLKQIRNAALCLATAAFVGSGLHVARPTHQPVVAHKVAAQTLLADGGQETHGDSHGKGHFTRPVLPA
jgi:hypothetical protein